MPRPPEIQDAQAAAADIANVRQGLEQRLNNSLQPDDIDVSIDSTGTVHVSLEFVPDGA